MLTTTKSVSYIHIIYSYMKEDIVQILCGFPWNQNCGNKF